MRKKLTAPMIAFFIGVFIGGVLIYLAHHVHDLAQLSHDSKFSVYTTLYELGGGIDWEYERENGTLENSVLHYARWELKERVDTIAVIFDLYGDSAGLILDWQKEQGLSSEQLRIVRQFFLAARDYYDTFSRPATMLTDEDIQTFIAIEMALRGSGRSDSNSLSYIFQKLDQFYLREGYYLLNVALG